MSGTQLNTVLIPPDFAIDDWVTATERLYTIATSHGVIGKISSADEADLYALPAWAVVLWRVNQSRSEFRGEGDSLDWFRHHLSILVPNRDLVEAMYAIYLSLRAEYDHEIGHRITTVREWLDHHYLESLKT